MALIVKSSKDTYILPLSAVDETVTVLDEDIKTMQSHPVFLLRGKEVPLLWLRTLTGGSEVVKRRKWTVVIVNKGGEKVGIVVDEILSQQQVLIKSLQELIRRTKGIAGATILGDGRVALIVDIDTLF